MSLISLLEGTEGEARSAQAAAALADTKAQLAELEDNIMLSQHIRRVTYMDPLDFQLNMFAKPFQQMEELRERKHHLKLLKTDLEIAMVELNVSNIRQQLAASNSEESE